MASEAVVVIEPPARGRRDHQVPGAALAQALEPRDRLGAVGGGMAEGAALLVLREVGGLAIREADQLAVAAADDEDTGSGRDRPRDRGVDSLDQRAVAELAGGNGEALLQVPRLRFQPARLGEQGAVVVRRSSFVPGK